MNKRFVLLTFASVFLLSAVIGSQLIVAVAAQRTVGVSEGDWAEYDVTVSGNGTAPPNPPPEVDWAKITVQEILDTNVTCEVRLRYPNATEETQTNVVDVNTGQGNGTSFFIAANLNAGDLIYNSTDPSNIFYGMTINETILRTYPVGNVEVNHWNLTMSYSVPGVNMTLSMSYYWYKSTGMMTELSMYYLVQQVGNMTWWEWEAVIIGIIPEFSSSLILPLFMIATLLAVIVLRLLNTISSTKERVAS